MGHLSTAGVGKRRHRNLELQDTMGLVQFGGSFLSPIDSENAVGGIWQGGGGERLSFL